MTDAPVTMTQVHRRLIWVLERLGLDVETEVRVGRYSLDCYVREVHLGFEADGRPYHRGTVRSRKDRERDAWILEHAGIPVLRVKDTDLRNRRVQDEQGVRITKFVDWHTADSAALSGRRVKGRIWLV